MKKPLFALALALTFVLILPLTVSASSVFWDADSITKIIQPLVGMRDYVAKFASFTATSTTATSSIAGPLQLTSLPSKTCLGTDVNGLIQTGTCGGGGGTVYLATSTGYTVGGVAYATGNGTVGTVATTTLSTTATGLTLATTTLIGSSPAIIALTAGYNIPLTASTTNWNDFYTTPSNRITAGSGLAWSANTLKADVNASSSVRATFNRKPRQSPPIVISNMDAGWSDFYATGTIAVDTTEFVLGTSSMRITAGNGGGNSGIRNNITDFNGSANGYSFWVRSNNWSQLATAQLLLSTNGVFTDFYFVDLKNFLVSPPTNEWIEIVVPRTNFTASGAPNWATVNDVIFRVTGTVGNTPTLWVDDLIRYKSASKGMVTLAFDDGEATQFTVAKPQMDRYHFVGTAYVIWDAIGTGGTYMTQTQVDGLHQGGWDIAGHGGTNLTTLTAAQIDADVSSMRNYLLNRGYRGADHYALPNGAYSSTTLPIVEKYFSTQRTIDTFSNDANYVVPRRVSALSLSNLTSTTTVFNRINQAIANGDHLIITFHKLVTTPTIDTEWEITKFIDTMAYLASTSVPVVPMSEAMVTDYETLRYFGNFITISGQLGVTGTSTLATTTISSTTIASLVVTGNTSLVGTLGVTGIATLGTANITRLGVNVNNVGSATIEAKSLTAGAIQGLRIEGDNIANTQFSSFLTADSFVRFSFLTDGTMKWGPGTAVADTQLLRNGVNSLQTLGAWTVNGTSTLATTTISNLTVTATTTTNTLRISSLLASRALFTNTTNDVVTSGGSAALLNSLTDETGTGVAVFATAPTFTTSIITPIIGGGTAVGSTLTYRSTSGAGTTDAHIWQVGNNGSIEAMRIIDGGLSGKLNIGTTTATSSLSIAVASSTALMPQTTPWGFMLSMTIAGVSYITHTYDYYGHQIFKGPAPVLTACGTSPTITGSDNGGFITVGTVATGCTMTFANAWITRPTCVISNQNMSITSTLTYSVTATAMVFTQATGFSSNVVNFTCQGQ